MKWNKDGKEGIVVAGGQGQGGALTQLSYPRGLFVDTSGTLYIADRSNHRVLRWPKGAQQGTVIVGGNGSRKQSKSAQLLPKDCLSIVKAICMSSIATIIVFNASIFRTDSFFSFSSSFFAL